MIKDHSDSEPEHLDILERIRNWPEAFSHLLRPRDLVYVLAELLVDAAAEIEDLRQVGVSGKAAAIGKMMERQ